MNVKKLINKGADKNARNYFGRTALHLAADKGLSNSWISIFSTETKRLFVDLGFGNIFRLLVDSHADIDVKDNYGQIPIHFAAKSGHYEIFKFLIKEYESRNIDYINATDDLGMNVLHFAAMNRKPKNTEMLQILLEKEADVNAIASDNTTALDYASATGISINSLS